MNINTPGMIYLRKRQYMLQELCSSLDDDIRIRYLEDQFKLESDHRLAYYMHKISWLYDVRDNWPVSWPDTENKEIRTMNSMPTATSRRDEMELRVEESKATKNKNSQDNVDSIDLLYMKNIHDLTSMEATHVSPRKDLTSISGGHGGFNLE